MCIGDETLGLLTQRKNRSILRTFLWNKTTSVEVRLPVRFPGMGYISSISKLLASLYGQCLYRELNTKPSENLTMLHICRKECCTLYIYTCIFFSCTILYTAYTPYSNVPLLFSCNERKHSSPFKVLDNLTRKVMVLLRKLSAC